MAPATRLLVAAVLTASTSIAAEAAGLVVNGGFETGDASGWALVSPGGFDFVCLAGTAAGSANCTAHSGSYAMTFGAVASPGVLSQDLATTAGSVYTLSFFLRNDASDGAAPADNNLDVYWGGVDVFSRTNMATFDYARFTVSTLTAGGAPTTLQFAGRNGPSQIFVDDVSVTAVPEPAAWALLAAGLLQTCIVLRRRSGLA